MEFPTSKIPLVAPGGPRLTAQGWLTVAFSQLSLRVLTQNTGAPALTGLQTQTLGTSWASVLPPRCELRHAPHCWGAPASLAHGRRQLTHPGDRGGLYESPGALTSAPNRGSWSMGFPSPRQREMPSSPRLPSISLVSIEAKTAGQSPSPTPSALPSGSRRRSQEVVGNPDHQARSSGRCISNKLHKGLWHVASVTLQLLAPPPCDRDPTGGVRKGCRQGLERPQQDHGAAGDEAREPQETVARADSPALLCTPS